MQVNGKHNLCAINLSLFAAWTNMPEDSFLIFLFDYILVLYRSKIWNWIKSYYHSYINSLAKLQIRADGEACSSSYFGNYMCMVLFPRRNKGRRYTGLPKQLKEMSKILYIWSAYISFHGIKKITLLFLLLWLPA